MSTTTTKSRADILRRILDVSQHLKRGITHSTLASCRATSSSRPSLPTDLPLELPSVQSIVPHLLSLGASEGLASSLSEAYERYARQWRSSVTDYAGRSWAKLSTAPRATSQLQDKMVAAFTALYNKQLQCWMSDLAMLLRSRPPSTNCGKPRSAKSSFNAHYVPMLEFMFSRNPFPTHADKAFLARKSGMTYKQIHVWFQNRRKRGKRSETEAGSHGALKSLAFSFDTLMSRLGERAIPEEERNSPIDSDESEYEWQCDSSDEEEPSPKHTTGAQSADISDFERPEYAYPSCYPPKDQRLAVASFPPPHWQRYPRTGAIVETCIDMDVLCTEFAGMSMLEVPKKRLVKKRQRSPRDRVESGQACPSSRTARTESVGCTTDPLPPCLRRASTPHKTPSPPPLLSAITPGCLDGHRCTCVDWVDDSAGGQPCDFCSLANLSPSQTLSLEGSEYAAAPIRSSARVLGDSTCSKPPGASHRAFHSNDSAVISLSPHKRKESPVSYIEPSAKRRRSGGTLRMADKSLIPAGSFPLSDTRTCLDVQEYRRCNFRIFSDTTMPSNEEDDDPAPHTPPHRLSIMQPHIFKDKSRLSHLVSPSLDSLHLDSESTMSSGLRSQLFDYYEHNCTDSLVAC